MSVFVLGLFLFYFLKISNKIIKMDVRMEEDGDDIHKKLTDLRINAVEEAVQVSRGTVQKTMVPNAAVKDRKSIQVA